MATVSKHIPSITQKVATKHASSLPKKKIQSIDTKKLERQKNSSVAMPKKGVFRETQCQKN